MPSALKPWTVTDECSDETIQIGEICGRLGSTECADFNSKSGIVRSEFLNSKGFSFPFAKKTDIPSRDLNIVECTCSHDPPRIHTY